MEATHLDFEVVGLEGEILEATKKTEDQALVQLAMKVIEASRSAVHRAEEHMRPMLLLRLAIFSICIGILIAIVVVASLVNLDVGIQSWGDVVGFAGKASQCLLVLPFLLSILFVERIIKRRKMLGDLRGLQKLNAQIYEAQFNHNPFGEVDPHRLNGYLDCCCGLLFLIRKAASSYDGTTDEVVLGQVAAIQAGSSDNHRNILMKMGMIRGLESVAKSNM